MYAYSNNLADILKQFRKIVRKSKAEATKLAHKWNIDPRFKTERQPR